MDQGSHIYPAADAPGARIACPSFVLPEDKERYEIWSVRVPVAIDVGKIFHGKTMPLRGVVGNNGSLKSDRSVLCTFEGSNSVSCAMIQCSRSEVDCYRILTKDINGKGGTSNGEESVMLPLGTFDRHTSIIEMPNNGKLHSRTTQEVFASSAEHAPEPSDRTTFRSAYSHVEQVQGLKRRWRPLGSSSDCGNVSSATENEAEHLKQLKKNNDESVPTHSERKRKTKAEKKEKKRHKEKKRKKDTRKDQKKAKKKRKSR